MVTLYSLSYSRRVQSKLNKRKTAGHRREESRHKVFQRPLPGELQRMYLIPPATNCDNMCEGWSTRETCLSLGVKGVFAGGWWQRHIVLVWRQLLMLQTTQKESKCSTYHIVCTNYLDRPEWFQVSNGQNPLIRTFQEHDFQEPTRTSQDNRHFWGMYKVWNSWDSFLRRY